MSYIEKEKLIKADIVSIENRVRHAFNQGYDLGFKDGKKAKPQEPRKGHWTEEFNDLEGEVRFTCSSCGKYQLFGTDFCYHCGSDNREVVEE